LGILNHPIVASTGEDIAFGREPFCTGQKPAFCSLVYAFVLALLFGLPHPLGCVNGFVKPLIEIVKPLYGSELSTYNHF